MQARLGMLIKKIARNLAIQLAIVSGTRVIGSIGTSLAWYCMHVSSLFLPTEPTFKS
jgi:hypothetical protein